MVLAMVGDPREHGALDGHRPEDRERVAHPLLRRERAVREETVVTDRDADARQQVADDQQHEVERMEEDPQSNAIAVIKPTNGNVTPSRLAILCARVTAPK